MQLASIVRSATLACALVFVASHAHADADKQACADAAKRGQVARDAGTLVAAENIFATCAAPTCPAVVREVCEGWLLEVRARLPRVVLHATAEDGRPLDRARVTIDADPAREFSLPDALRLDPGAHTIRVEADGRTPWIGALRLTEAQDEEIHARLDPILGPLSPKDRTTPPRTRPVPTGVFVLGGLSLAGLASFGTFGTLSVIETDRLHGICRPACPPGERDTAVTFATIADVSLLVGVLAGGSALVWYMLRPEVRSELSRP